MNLLKFFRKPILAYFLSGFILFISCEKYDSLDGSELPNQQVDSQNNQEITRALISKLGELDSYLNSDQNSKNLSQSNVFDQTLEFLSDQNIEISFLENQVEIAEFMNLEDPKQFMINTNDYDINLINLTDYFYKDLLQSQNLSKSLKKFEDRINNVSLNFQQKKTLETMLIIIKSIEEKGASIEVLQKGGGSCAWAFVGLALSFTALALSSVATVATLGGTSFAVYLAATSFVYASINVGRACRSDGVSSAYANANYFRNQSNQYGNRASIYNYDDVKITSIYSNIISSNDLKGIPLYRGRYSTTGTIPIYVYVKQYSKEVVRADIFAPNNSTINGLGLIQFVQIAETNQDNICLTSTLESCFDVLFDDSDQEDLTLILGGL